MQLFQWKIEEKTPLNVLFSGVLTRDTVYILWKSQEEFIAKQINAEKIIWNLEQLQQIDSAGIALLIEILDEMSQHYNKKIELLNVPTQCSALIELFGLAKWFRQYL